MGGEDREGEGEGDGDGEEEKAEGESRGGAGEGQGTGEGGGGVREGKGGAGKDGGKSHAKRSYNAKFINKLNLFPYHFSSLRSLIFSSCGTNDHKMIVYIKMYIHT